MQLSCREAARWMSLRRDEPLGRWRAVALRLHLRLCGDCREVERQLPQLGGLAAGLYDAPPHDERDAPQAPAQRGVKDAG
jgi:hypothetical protein